MSAGQLVFVDVETTGLNPDRHEVWEVAWATSEGPVHSGVVDHEITTADPAALQISGHGTRCDVTRHRDHTHYDPSWILDHALAKNLDGATLVAANPAFDAAFLARRWGGRTPWHYRLFDIEAYAMPALGLTSPQGLSYIADALGLPKPDHTAAGDVRVLRDAYRMLRNHYATQPTIKPLERAS